MKNKMMKKIGISVAVSAALASVASANVEVNPFGFLGAYYTQGFNKMPAFTADDKGTQAKYGAGTAHFGLDFGLSKTLSFGIGAWGAGQFYETYYGQNKVAPVGDEAYLKTWDVSDAYIKYDDETFSLALGRFDIGAFYRGKYDTEYSGMDYLWGNIQGAALGYNFSKNASLWALWMNSKLGVNGNYNRMNYDMANFNTFDGWKRSHKGEVFMGGLDLGGEVFRFSPFAIYDTDYRERGAAGKARDVLSAGAKIQLNIKGNGMDSITTLRAIWQEYKNGANDEKVNPTMFWADQEFVFFDVFKLGGGYIKTSKQGVLLYNHDNSRFYGYRAYALSTPAGNGLNYTAQTPIYNGNNSGVWYVFGGLKPTSRLEVDLLYSGGDYSEISAVAQLRLFGQNDGVNFKIGGGVVSTKGLNYDSDNDGWTFDERRNNVIGFARLSF